MKAWLPFFSFQQAGSLHFLDQKACLLFSFVLSPFSLVLPHILWFVEGLNPNSYIKPWGSLWDQFKGSPLLAALLLTIPLLHLSLVFFSLLAESVVAQFQPVSLWFVTVSSACLVVLGLDCFLFTSPFCICWHLKKQQLGNMKMH